MAEAAAGQSSQRVAVVGMSSTRICGVRDHATLLSGELEREGVRCTTHWLTREQADLRGARREVRAWTRRLRGELEASRPDAVLLHYSVFAYSHRGLPVFVHPVLSALRAAGAPVVNVIHEAVYPWTIGGARGKLWALSQRAALIEVMRRSAAVLVTADFRADWLRSRPWLARRPVAVAPVFSNLPAPSDVAAAERTGERVGLFGYSYEGIDGALVLDALRVLSERGRHPTLSLLGAPGPDSASAQAWLDAAEARGLRESLSFSGTLSGQQLSDALAHCDVLLSLGAGGPTSRKGTLAGSLASGRPVIALDGPRRWSELLEAQAVRLVAQTPQSLADGLAELLADEALREQLGRRGRAFAEERMGTARTAQAVRALMGEIGL